MQLDAPMRTFDNTPRPTALVVFRDASELWWAKLFKRGFRHCFLCFYDGRRWLFYDPMAHHTEISVLEAAPDRDVAGYYLGLGYRVVPTPVRNAVRRPLPIAPFTCVEAVKRVLGIRAWWVFTPWRLYRHLIAVSH